MTTQAQTFRTPATAQAALVPEAERSGPRSAGWWGMLVLIMNEAVIFAALIASYLYIRFNSPTWPQANIKLPDLVIPSIMTGILVTSSLFMQWGVSSIRKGHTGRMKFAFIVAFLEGLAFLSLVGLEYATSEFSPQLNAYGSLFFAITGIHGTHVLIASLMNLYVQIRSYKGHFTARRHLAVDNVVMYWHFVDIVWLVIFTTLYLSPYF